MKDHTSGQSVPQPPFDYIDYPVSDIWRDHYAAQGLTYSSGRRTVEPIPIPSVPAITHADRPNDTEKHGRDKLNQAFPIICKIRR